MEKIQDFCCPKDKGLLLKKLVENKLVCSVCAKEYPIIHDIPSFIDAPDGSDSFSSKTFSLEWTYFSFGDFKKLNDRRISKNEINNQRWDDFDYEGSFFETTGLTKEELKGKKILEVGVGSGRLLSIPLKYGADCYGIDYSEAAFIANKELHKLDYENLDERLHLCQADLFQLPFENEYFDYIYSIGVLHHTPDTKNAFSNLPRLLKKGGKLSIWVYPEYNIVHNYKIRVWRRIFHTLPHSVFFNVCKILATSPISFLYRKLKILHLILFLPSIESVDYKNRVRVILDYYSPKHLNEHSYHEVYQWFSDSGFENIKVLKQPISFVATKSSV